MLIVGYEVTHWVEEQNWAGYINYRFDRLGVGEVGCWSYRPEHRTYWTDVNSYDICRLLDRGLHSREFEVLYEMRQRSNQHGVLSSLRQ